MDSGHGVGGTDGEWEAGALDNMVKDWRIGHGAGGAVAPSPAWESWSKVS